MPVDISNVIDLAGSLIRLESESQNSNLEITRYIESILGRMGFEIERIEYEDAAGVRKACTVAKLGKGSGGLGFFAHSDTVPGMANSWQPYEPIVRVGRLFGRGSCDMKGPIAATLVAMAQSNLETLIAPLYFVISADEEMHYTGAYQVLEQSKFLKDAWPESGVVIEPTRMVPVHAHKGGVRMTAIAHGKAAHTSTGSGVSANFIIAPFLAEMAKLAELFRAERRFQNNEFEPPTNGFNMVLNDGDCAPNVTAEKTVCTMSIRPMPNDHHEEAIALVEAAAKKYDLEFIKNAFPMVYTDTSKPIVQASIELTGVEKSVTVPFGTEAAVYTPYCDLVILGPGDIAQAHTVGEWIDVKQLRHAVDVYQQLIQRFCSL